MQKSKLKNRKKIEQEMSMIFGALSIRHISRDNKHTHPFNGPLSRTTRVSRYQKGKTNLDTEARDSEWQWHHMDRMQVYTSLQTDSHPIPTTQSLYRPDTLLAAQPTASKQKLEQRRQTPFYRFVSFLLLLF